MLVLGKIGFTNHANESIIIFIKKTTFFILLLKTGCIFPFAEKRVYIDDLS